ncbi:helix-turn-helix domain-containing protein [Mycolicibacterium brisbanense]|uniref:HTH cro/C1-type domain-containing protein n=1 Tax=Mycolicibacterium brisbanense TaxID=146020 RepID=A0A100W6P6_9MYCO|nr:helix-turn-helix transcriptional regulator [Mycolicibacterium brisbanense]MCV7157991.1 helix-turn-helix domain-containing protein [Mycolicibacterium brisbanense]GAS92639.1 uncharacterized protein RMCB_6735 [Mycolicibacterium brisbanense]
MDLERFGRIVLSRRIELGLTQEEVERNGGPTDTTLGKIENGEWTPGNRKTTLRKLDVGLRWRDGSAQRTLAGGHPENLTDVPPRPSHVEPAPEDDPVVRLVDIVNANWLRAEAVVNQAMELDLPESFLHRIRSLVRGFGAYLAEEITGLAAPRAERDEAMAELFRRRDRADQLLRQKEEHNANIHDRDQTPSSGTPPEGNQIQEVGDDQDDAEASRRPSSSRHPPSGDRAHPSPPSDDASQSVARIRSHISRATDAHKIRED